MDRYRTYKKPYYNFRLRKFIKTLHHPTVPYKFIHHHHGYPGMAEIGDLLLQEKEKAKKMGHEFFLFTCVRDPLQFIISRVNHMRNVNKMETFTYQNVIKDEIHQNTMFQYYLRNHFRRLPIKESTTFDKKDLNKMMNLMDRVFILESFPEPLLWLSKQVDSFSESLDPSNHKANVGKHALLPTAEEIDQLRESNQEDHILYDWAKKHG